MATAMVSALSGRAVKNEVAMTGEITLRGDVLAIGGVKEKVLAAHRAKLKTIILPSQNRKDMEDVPDEPKRDLKFHFVDNIREVFRIALMPAKKTPAKAKREKKVQSPKSKV